MRSTEPWTSHVLSLDSELASLASAGGKGTNLARLMRAGLPVPGGFIVATPAYTAVVAANGLASRITGALARLEGPSEAPSAPDPTLLEGVSSEISSLFRTCILPDGLSRDIREAYSDLGSPPVAVRSSATAEDLPELSFAGQQETYLNVVGEDRLIEAVRGCWASLWTARAIGYRLRNCIPQDEISLAVVVQRLIESESSGVMFTANPVTGLRSETVVEATFGLGEALVSGLVEPDRFVVDTAARRITERVIGSKHLSVRANPGGGTHQSLDGGRDHSSLTDEQILVLADLGARVAALSSSPQDIEWALAGGKPYLLQARAVTSLFPLPEGSGADPLQVYFSFAAVQGLMDPITPLGVDMLRTVFAAVSHIFGYRYTRETQRVLATAGGRLWVNFTPLVASSVGRRLVRGALTYIEPTVAQALDSIWDDPRLSPRRRGIRPAVLVRLLRFFGPLAANVARNMISPQRRRERLSVRAEALLERVSRMPLRGDSALERLASLVDSVDHVLNTLIPPTFIRLVSGVATGMASLNLLNVAARRFGAAPPAERGIAEIVLQTSRAVPHNPTTEMDLELWRIATLLRDDAEVMRSLPEARAHHLARRYGAGDLPQPAQKAIGCFLERYGARGLAEIDTGRARWRDEPEHLFESLAGYLRIDDPERSPEAVFARSARQAEEAVEQIEGAARGSARGLRARMRAARVRFAAKRAREFLGFREFPKFFAVRIMDLFRQRMLIIGGELETSGTIARADDLFYLDFGEQRSVGLGRLSGEAVRSLVAERREVFRREGMRRQIPRLLASDGRAFYAGIGGVDSSDREAAGTQEGVLVGSPVSPGSVEARVRVVLDPRKAGLEPGEIMVCPGTDPSWTPLFLIASGLVMEVGGMMTHGAVVAREYGIPAVVGIHEATRRLSTGELIRLNGSTGQVTLLASSLRTEGDERTGET